MMVYYHIAHICKENMSKFSHKMLDEVQTKILDLLEIHLILMTKLKAVNLMSCPEKQSKLKRFLNVQSFN